MYPSQLLGDISTTFLSLGLLLSNQPWAESICCAENVADLHSFQNANQNGASLEQFAWPREWIPTAFSYIHSNHSAVMIKK